MDKNISTELYNINSKKSRGEGKVEGEAGIHIFENTYNLNSLPVVRLISVAFCRYPSTRI